MEYNIYCDESCHLENDRINVMVLGGIWCPKSKAKDINHRIMEIKQDYGIDPVSEVKWTKISPSNELLYRNLVDYFFDDDDLHFRGLIVPDKSILDHQSFNQTHDDWYYKMYFDMLKTIFSPLDCYNVFIDIKDTHSFEKSQKMMEVCRNQALDFSGHIIKKVQPIRSNEVQIIQLSDILIGAMGYENRIFNDNVCRSPAKQNIISRIKKRSGYTLKRTTLYREEKINLLVWAPREAL